MDGLKIASALVLIALYAAFWGALWMLKKRAEPKNADAMKSQLPMYEQQLRLFQTPKVVELDAPEEVTPEPEVPDLRVNRPGKPERISAPMPRRSEMAVGVKKALVPPAPKWMTQALEVLKNEHKPI